MTTRTVRSRRSTPGAALLAALLACPSILAQDTAAPRGIPRVVARVNGTEIRFDEFSAAVNQYVIAGRMGPHSGVSISDIQHTVLDRLIASLLVKERAREMDITATDQEVEARVDSLRARAGSPDEFRLFLSVQGLDEDRLRLQLRDQIIAEKVVEAEVFEKMEVPEAEVKAYFNSHRDELQRPEEVKVRHVFVRLRPDMTDEERAQAREKIDAIKQRLDEGEDLSRLAVELSEDAAAADGGELGWLREDQVSGPFQLVAFTTGVGEISDVVATDYGYHILEVMDRKSAGTLTLEEARPTISELLRDERVPEAVRDYLGKLRAQAQVQVFLPEGDSE